MRLTSSQLCGQSTLWTVATLQDTYNHDICSALRLCVFGCTVQYAVAVCTGEVCGSLKLESDFRQNKIQFQALIDEIEEQSGTWTVNFVDSKPHYKTPIILTSAVQCACVHLGAVCNM